MGKTKWSYEVETRAVIRALRKLGYALDRVDYNAGWGVEEGSEKVTLKPSQVEKAVKAIIVCESKPEPAVKGCHLYVRYAHVMPRIRGKRFSKRKRNSICAWHHPNAGRSLFFYLVLGNSPGELVADYQVPRSLEHRKPLDDAMMAVYDKFRGKAR